MKKQILLLALILFGAVIFRSLNNNGLGACDKNCRAACFAIKKTPAKTVSTDYDEDEYSRARPLQYSFVNF